MATTGWLLLLLATPLLCAEALAARSAKYLRAASWDSTRVLVGVAAFAGNIGYQLLIRPKAYCHITAGCKLSLDVHGRHYHR